MRHGGPHIFRNKSRMRNPWWSCAPAKVAVKCESRLGFESLEERLALSHAQLAAPPDDSRAASHVASQNGAAQGGSNLQPAASDGNRDASSGGQSSGSS